MKKQTRKTIHKVIKTTTVFMNGEFVSNGLDSSGNPKFNFLSVKYCTPKEFDKEVNRLQRQYGEVRQVDGHKIEVGFTEVINEKNRAKEVEKYLKQYRYKDGSWQAMTPNTEGEHVEVKGSDKWETWQKVLVGALGVAVLAVLGWFFGWFK